MKRPNLQAYLSFGDRVLTLKIEIFAKCLPMAAQMGVEDFVFELFLTELSTAQEYLFQRKKYDARFNSEKSSIEVTFYTSVFQQYTRTQHFLSQSS